MATGRKTLPSAVRMNEEDGRTPELLFVWNREDVPLTLVEFPFIALVLQAADGA